MVRSPSPSELTATRQRFSSEEGGTGDLYYCMYILHICFFFQSPTFARSIRPTLRVQQMPNRTNVESNNVPSAPVPVLPPCPRPCLSCRVNFSSSFLRARLNNKAVSREHLRVEALPGTSPRGVRLSVVGANPVMIIREKQVRYRRL